MVITEECTVAYSQFNYWGDAHFIFYLNLEKRLKLATETSKGVLIKSRGYTELGGVMYA